MLKQNYWQANLCVEMKPLPNILVIFGASGDLAVRKLLPALFNLYQRGQLHPATRVVGCARTAMNDETFRQQQAATMPDEPGRDAFLGLLHYVSGAYDQPQTYTALQDLLRTLEKALPERVNHTFYLATPSSVYDLIVPQLAASGLVQENYQGMPWRHVVLEKPFGRDSASAEALDRMLHESLQERQIYRIDHYLGKETVQNILMLRFANIIFEPVWNSTYVDHVQITAAESIGIGHRAGYYDQAGQLRDMFQNHLLAMLSLVAMEAPVAFEPNSLRDEQLKLIQSIRPFPLEALDRHLVRGQYVRSERDDIILPGYHEEAGIPDDSQTETYAAAKILIDNWRWRGVPFYLRSGKRLKKKLSEIAIIFKTVPHSIFPQLPAENLDPDALILNVQPAEGVSLEIQAKQPGTKLCMGKLTMNFSYADSLTGPLPDAYERLLLDTILGDQTLFIRSDVIAAAWRLFTPVLQAWKENRGARDCPCPLHRYAAGSEGPEATAALFAGTGRVWRPL